MNLSIHTASKAQCKCHISVRSNVPVVQALRKMGKNKNKSTK